MRRLALVSLLLALGACGGGGGGASAPATTAPPFPIQNTQPPVITNADYEGTWRADIASKMIDGWPFEPAGALLRAGGTLTCSRSGFTGWAPSGGQPASQKLDASSVAASAGRQPSWYTVFEDRGALCLFFGFDSARVAPGETTAFALRLEKIATDQIYAWIYEQWRSPEPNVSALHWRIDNAYCVRDL